VGQAGRLESLPHKSTVMDFRLPELGEGVYEAELSRWLVKPGQQVRAGEGLLEVLTDKATMEVPAPFEGTIEALEAEQGKTIKVGDVVLKYQGTASEATHQEAAEAPAIARKSVAHEVNGPAARTGGAVRAAPTVRLLARKLGIDLERIRGSGPQGRILVEDLTSQMQKASGKPAAPPPPRDFGVAGTRVKMQGVRKKIAEQMVLSTRTIPHFSYVDECDVGDLVRLREGLRETLADRGVRLTFLPFFVKAVATALKEVPIVNATFDEAAGEIVLHNTYHIGLAVAAPSGLIVPVLHDAHRKNLLDIAQEVDRLTSAARAGKSKLEDLKGGTFTITSIGNFGGLFATPIINPPQVGILGIGKIAKRPVCDAQGTVRAADMVYLSMTFDHRVLDGAAATAFGNAVIRHLRQPAKMLIE
jgi:2-oxoisovalerate dehydrogenase E2 component (dihydrolipoyl transacylase)